MSRELTKEILVTHKNAASLKFENYIDKLITSGDPKLESKADKLCYWMEDWTKFLDFESQFKPTSLRRYKRGEIIKVHLGFNIGSEEGGLHYAVVLDKENAKSSPVVTIVPLTSVKQTTDLSKLRKGSIYIGTDIYQQLNMKCQTHAKMLRDKIDDLNSIREQMNTQHDGKLPSELKEKLESATEALEYAVRLQKEISKMKRGSIALVNQITTISKIRIYDPKTDYDILSHIKLPCEKLDMIDKEVLSLYTNNK